MDRNDDRQAVWRIERNVEFLDVTYIWTSKVDCDFQFLGPVIPRRDLTAVERFELNKLRSHKRFLRDSRTVAVGHLRQLFRSQIVKPDIAVLSRGAERECEFVLVFRKRRSANYALSGQRGLFCLRGDGRDQRFA